MNSIRRLGKRAPRLDTRTLRMAKYLRLPVAPAESSWCVQVPEWPMYLNDELGDCVFAAMGHMVEQWSFYASHPTLPSNAEILKAYEAVGGYVPGDPSTDNGANMLDALNYWRRVGLGRHKILAYVSVDPRSHAEVKAAVQIFGNCFIGLALPISAQAQNVWTVPDGGPFGDGSPGSWGGHAVEIAAYSPQSLTCITWGQRLKMSWNFFSDYCDEAYAVLSADWITQNGMSPSHFSLAQLKADLAAL